MDPAPEVVRNRVGTDGNPIAVAIQDYGGAVAFLDHISGYDRPVGVLDHHAVAQMVIEIQPWSRTPAAAL
jgi:hypothetical protein